MATNNLKNLREQIDQHNKYVDLFSRSALCSEINDPSSNFQYYHHSRDINSLYPHVSNPAGSYVRFLPDDDEGKPSWWLSETSTLSSLYQDVIQNGLLGVDINLNLGTAVAVAGALYSGMNQIDLTYQWVIEHTPGAVTLFDYPYDGQKTFVFFNWDEALSFKLAWVD